MEACAQDIALAHGDDVARIVLDVGLGHDRLGLGLVDAVGEGRDDGDARGLLRRVGGQDLFDDGGADKDAVKGLGLGVGQEGQVEGRDEALNLAAKVVAVDADVEAANELLAALFGGVGLLGEEDEAGAGAPGRFLEDSEEDLRRQLSCRPDEQGRGRDGDSSGKRANALDKVAQRLEEARLGGDKGNGGALAAGDDEGVAACQLVWGAHLDGLDGGREDVGELGGGLADEGDVLGEAALESEDADGGGGWLHVGKSRRIKYVYIYIYIQKRESKEKWQYNQKRKLERGANRLVQARLILVNRPSTASAQAGLLDY